MNQDLSILHLVLNASVVVQLVMLFSQTFLFTPIKPQCSSTLPGGVAMGFS